MPIEVHAVSEEKFLEWIEEAKEKFAKVSEKKHLQLASEINK